MLFASQTLWAQLRSEQGRRDGYKTPRKVGQIAPARPPIAVRTSTTRNMAHLTQEQI